MYNLTSSKNMSYLTNSNLILNDKSKLMDNMDINKKTNKALKFCKVLVLMIVFILLLLNS